MIKFTFSDGTIKICNDTDNSDGHMTIEVFPLPNDYDGMFGFTCPPIGLFNRIKEIEEPTYQESKVNYIKSLPLQNNPQENK